MRISSSVPAGEVSVKREAAKGPGGLTEGRQTDVQNPRKLDLRLLLLYLYIYIN